MVPLVLLLLLFSPADQVRQVVTFHLAASRVYTLHPSDNLTALQTFLFYDPALLLLAPAGAIVGLSLRPARYVTGVYLLWTLSTAVFLFRYHPLLQHQFIPLLPALALLGGALSAAIAGGTARLSRAVLGLAAVAGMVYLGVLAVRTLSIDAHTFVTASMPNRNRLVALVDRLTPADAFIVADDPMVALLAHRALPPGLEDPSMVRMRAGYLTSGQAIAATVRYHVRLVVLSRPKYVRGRLVGPVVSYYLPGYVTWLGRHGRVLPNPVPNARTEVYALGAG